MNAKPTYDELLAALTSLCESVRDYDRYGSDDDLAIRRASLDAAINLVARAESAKPRAVAAEARPALRLTYEEAAAEAILYTTPE